jgi:hypothetical protein
MKFASILTKFAAITSIAAAGFTFTATAQADLTDLRGVWINVNDNTRGITKVVIGGSGNTVTMATWGSCSPSDCEWGQVNAIPLASGVGASPASADRIMALYEKSFKTSTLNAYRAGNKLIVENATDFKDNRADTFSSYTFKRAPMLVVPVPPRPIFPVLPLATNLDTLEGHWKNIDANTRGITRIKINVDGENVKVRAFGSCSPSDCDWGWTNGMPLTDAVGDAPTSAKRVMAKWDQGFAKRTMIINREGDTLIAQMTTVYSDGRSDRFNTYVFKL